MRLWESASERKAGLTGRGDQLGKKARGRHGRSTGWRPQPTVKGRGRALLHPDDDRRDLDAAVGDAVPDRRQDLGALRFERSGQQGAGDGGGVGGERQLGEGGQPEAAEDRALVDPAEQPAAVGSDHTGGDPTVVLDGTCPARLGQVLLAAGGPGATLVGERADVAARRARGAHDGAELHERRAARADRLHAIMGEGGLTDCSSAQNCVRVCPKEIPLTTAIVQENGRWFYLIGEMSEA